MSQECATCDSTEVVLWLGNIPYCHACNDSRNAQAAAAIEAAQSPGLQAKCTRCGSILVGNPQGSNICAPCISKGLPRRTKPKDARELVEASKGRRKVEREGSSRTNRIALDSRKAQASVDATIARSLTTPKQVDKAILDKRRAGGS